MRKISLDLIDRIIAELKWELEVSDLSKDDSKDVRRILKELKALKDK